MGHSNISEAESGDVGLAKMRRFGCDLVLMDWNMPGKTGLDSLKEIKRDDKLKETPVIMITSKTEKESLLKAVQAGAANYIIKPFDPTALEAKIKQAVE